MEVLDIFIAEVIESMFVLIILTVIERACIVIPPKFCELLKLVYRKHVRRCYSGFTTVRKFHKASCLWILKIPPGTNIWCLLSSTLPMLCLMLSPYNTEEQRRWLTLDASHHPPLPKLKVLLKTFKPKTSSTINLPIQLHWGFSFSVKFDSSKPITENHLRILRGTEQFSCKEIYSSHALKTFIIIAQS